MTAAQQNSTSTNRSTAEWLAEARARGLFKTGLPAPYGSDGGYEAIAARSSELTRLSGRPGVGMAFAVRQLVARFFIAEHGTEAQRARWLPGLAAGDVPLAIAISEANAGAHPKLLTTRAERAGGDYVLTGEKSWVTNAPVAELIIVLAILDEAEGRKRFGAFLVPRHTEGLIIRSGDDDGKHGAHCPVSLQGCRLPDSALLAVEGDAFGKLAVPFRTLEDAVIASVLAASFHNLLALVAPHVAADGRAEIGALVGLGSLLDMGAAAAARSLDSGNGHDIAALVGVRLLTTELIQRIKSLPGAPASRAEPARLIAGIEGMENIARRARLAYQERLGTSLLVPTP